MSLVLRERRALQLCTVAAAAREARSPTVSSAFDENHEVVRANSRCPIGGWVEPTDQVLEGADERLPSPLGLQHHARTDERSEIRCILLDDIIDRVERELDGFVLDRRLGADSVEDIVDVGLDPPTAAGATRLERETAGTTRSM
jgi:hypothetical protein